MLHCNTNITYGFFTHIFQSILNFISIKIYIFNYTCIFINILFYISIIIF